MEKRVLLSFVGPSGSGKTTAAKYANANLIKLGYSVCRIDVAEPLRLIQNYAYKLFGRPWTGMVLQPESYVQDVKLLGFLAGHFKEYLGPTFEKRLELLLYDDKSNFVINADCRNNTYQCLKDLGFIFIRLETSPSTRISRLKKRDGSYNKLMLAVDATDEVKEDFIIINNFNLSHLEDKIKCILDESFGGLNGRDNVNNVN